MRMDSGVMHLPGTHTECTGTLLYKQLPADRQRRRTEKTAAITIKAVLNKPNFRYGLF